MSELPKSVPMTDQTSLTPMKLRNSYVRSSLVSKLMLFSNTKRLSRLPSLGKMNKKPLKSKWTSLLSSTKTKTSISNWFKKVMQISITPELMKKSLNTTMIWRLLKKKPSRRRRVSTLLKIFLYTELMIFLVLKTSLNSLKLSTSWRDKLELLVLLN